MTLCVESYQMHVLRAFASKNKQQIQHRRVDRELRKSNVAALKSLERAFTPGAGKRRRCVYTVRDTFHGEWEGKWLTPFLFSFLQRRHTGDLFPWQSWARTYTATRRAPISSSINDLEQFSSTIQPNPTILLIEQTINNFNNFLLFNPSKQGIVKKWFRFQSFFFLNIYKRSSSQFWI